MVKLLRSQAYIFVMIAAVLAGALLPQAKFLSLGNTIFLQIIFFLSCLRIDLKLVYSYIKDWRFLLAANFLMLIGFPLLVWAVNLLHPTNLGFAVFLLAAMPIGMTAPLLVELAGLKNESTMVLTVTTSLLATITIPLLVKILFGESVDVSASDIFWQLAFVILLPFLFAVGIRAIKRVSAKKIDPFAKPVSLALLGCIIAGAVAKNAKAGLALTLNPAYLLAVLAVLYVFFAVVILIGYYAFFWETKETRASASVALACMNFTLAIYLSSKFFPEPSILLPLVIAIIPWATVMPVWKNALGKRLNQTALKNS